MDVQQKIQTVLNVIDGKQPPSALRSIIDEAGDGHEINVFKAATDFIVARVLQQCEAGKAQFRFRIKEHNAESFTDWQTEGSQFAASMAMGQIRLQHPQAEIAIERRY